MLRSDGSEQKDDGKKSFVPPGFVFVIFPVILSLLSVLILGRLPWLIGAYNYLRGAPSPIDQFALALLGSDLTRIIILISIILGMVIGLYLSRFVTTKLDVVRKEGESRISVRLYLALLFQWEFFILPIQAIWFLDLVIFGYPTSSFLSDFGYYMMAGFFMAFTIPVLLRYGLLVMHAKSIDSKIRLIELRGGNRFMKRLQLLILKVIPEDPDP
ncbi:hypothetical protein EU528_08830 [Candidatus Thorarchaeota archaeon]|nr:MAG: hypothetical protein EU528_08830 [Candidatus Thorarchaeota archaeon]